MDGIKCAFTYLNDGSCKHLSTGKQCQNLFFMMTDTQTQSKSNTRGKRNRQTAQDQDKDDKAAPQCLQPCSTTGEDEENTNKRKRRCTGDAVSMDIDAVVVATTTTPSIGLEQAPEPAAALPPVVAPPCIPVRVVVPPVVARPPSPTVALDHVAAVAPLQPLVDKRQENKPKEAKAAASSSRQTFFCLIVYIAWCMSYNLVQDVAAQSAMLRFRCLAIDVVCFTLLVVLPSLLTFTPSKEWTLQRFREQLKMPAVCIWRLFLLMACELVLQRAAPVLLLMYHSTFHSAEATAACATVMRNGPVFLQSQAEETLYCMYPFVRHWKWAAVPDAQLFCRHAVSSSSSSSSSGDSHFDGLCVGFRFETMLAMLNRSSLWISAGMFVVDGCGLAMAFVCRLRASSSSSSSSSDSGGGHGLIRRWGDAVNDLVTSSGIRACIAIFSMRVITYYVEVTVMFRLVRLSLELEKTLGPYSSSSSSLYAYEEIVMRTCLGCIVSVVETFLALLVERAVVSSLCSKDLVHGCPSMVRDLCWSAVSVFMFPWVNPVIRTHIESVYEYVVGGSCDDTYAKVS